MLASLTALQRLCAGAELPGRAGRRVCARLRACGQVLPNSLQLDVAASRGGRARFCGGHVLASQKETHQNAAGAVFPGWAVPGPCLWSFRPGTGLYLSRVGQQTLPVSRRLRLSTSSCITAVDLSRRLFLRTVADLSGPAGAGPFEAVGPSAPIGALVDLPAVVYLSVF